MTSSIRIAQVFRELAGKKTRALWKVYEGMFEYITKYACIERIMMHIFILMITQRSVDILWSQINLYSLIIHLNTVGSMLCHEYTNKIICFSIKCNFLYLSRMFIID